MEYRIYPPIGVARVGNSESEHYFGPERPDSLGTEMDAEGVETAITSTKDREGHVKRQAVRFRVFEFSDEHPGGRPVELPEGARIRWAVTVANIKDAILRAAAPPLKPDRPQFDPNRSNRIIRPDGPATLVGAGAGPVALSGKYLSQSVALGEVRTDVASNLIFLGGDGVSDSPEQRPIGNETGGGGYYNNRGWFDDVCDGPVRAEIVLESGDPIRVAPGWVVVAPPDFAPGVKPVVSLHDVIRQVAKKAGWLTIPSVPIFERDIRPLIDRTRNLRWTNNNEDWGAISDDWQRLADPGPQAAQLRQRTADRVRKIGNVLRDYEPPDPPNAQHVYLLEWQLEHLQQWQNGHFVAGAPVPEEPAAQRLTRSVLGAAVGKGFFPGIEAGILLKDAGIYSQPFDFRLSHDVVEAGWLTALMALPWQADFLKCEDAWWPSQRPDYAPQDNGDLRKWARPLSYNGHRKITEDQFVMQFGAVVPRGRRHIEDGRTLPSTT